MEEALKQSEKDRDVRCEKVQKEYNRVEMEMESRRRDLEARQKNVEAVVAEVLLHHLLFWLHLFDIIEI